MGIKYDLRQIRLIEKKIGLFENSQISFFDFFNDLGGILNALELVNDSWKEAFRTEINALEMIHDSTEDGSISKWIGDPKEAIYKSVLKLKSMTTSILREYLKNYDPNILESAALVGSDWIICPKCDDAWQSNSKDAMVICPRCECPLHNPQASLEKNNLNLFTSTRNFYNKLIKRMRQDQDLYK